MLKLLRLTTTNKITLNIIYTMLIRFNFMENTSEKETFQKSEMRICAFHDMI